MPKKAFFAAFVIDEENYTPEPGPVDWHFVVCDLAQSNFGEQPGVSHFIVWDSVEDLISDHRQRGPITVDYLEGKPSADRGPFAHTPTACPSGHHNRGDDICEDCGADLNPPALPAPSGGSGSPPSGAFRDHLSPVMRDALAFEYFEVRPCIERDRQVASYASEDEYAADLTAARQSGKAFRTFWTLYGIDAGVHTAIGDFVSKDAAHEVMNAILAVPAAARNAINVANPVRRGEGSRIDTIVGKAADWLDDMINQSSNAERI